MNLAIKGHYTRGEEVIKILEMLGGRNVDNLDGNAIYYYYTIMDDKKIIGAAFYLKSLDDKFYILSLEEFLEKFPYKVGDKVIIKVNNQEAIIDKAVWCCDTIIYWLKYDDCLEGNWRTEHLQPYKEETMEIPEKLMPKIDFNEYCKDKYILDLGNYEIKEENGKTYAVRKRLEYPKTYEECCKIMQVARPIIWFDYNDVSSISEEGDEYERHIENTLCSFRELLICRDAYWRIAGEQMGLGKPWEPDYHEKSYEQGSPIKYVIYYTGTHITKEQKCTPSYILAFPTAEMRDAFFENFKDLIEQCKELL